jgi:hypothetical protein
MFGKKKSSKDIIEKLESYETEIKGLRDRKHELEMDIEKIKLEKKNEMEETKHLVKLRDEKKELEFKRKEMDIEAAKAIAIATVKDEYRDKMEKQLSKETENIKTMYGQILERLPNIKVGLKGDV